MKNRVLSLMVALGVTALSGIQAFAEIGVVDMNRINQSYNKVQSLSQEDALKQLELRKLELQTAIQLNELKAAQSNNPVGQGQKEKELTEAFQAKRQEYANWREAQLNMLDKSISNAIEAVAKSKNLNAVVQKNDVVWGGIDITSEVLTRLNTAK